MTLKYLAASSHQRQARGLIRFFRSPGNRLSRRTAVNPAGAGENRNERNAESGKDKDVVELSRLWVRGLKQWWPSSADSFHRRVRRGCSGIGTAIAAIKVAIDPISSPAAWWNEFFSLQGLPLRVLANHRDRVSAPIDLWIAFHLTIDCRRSPAPVSAPLAKRKQE